MKSLIWNIFLWSSIFFLIAYEKQSYWFILLGLLLTNIDNDGRV